MNDFVNLYRNALQGTVLEYKYLGNTLADYIIAILIFVAAFSALTAIIKYVEKFYEKQAGKFVKGDLLTIFTKFKKAVPAFKFTGAIYVCLNALNLHAKVSKIAEVAMLIGLTYFLIRLTIAIVDFFIHRKFSSDNDKTGAQAIISFIPAVNFVIWALGVVFFLSNLGFDISALIAGLGIGGMAVALAAQSILGDLFSYLAILTDKPFEIGDLLTIDGFTGRVTRIGIKTTRLTASTGETLVFANSDMTKSRIRNYKAMEQRRVEFQLFIAPETNAEKLQTVSDHVQKAIEPVEHAIFERCAFSNIGEYNLVFTVVYFVDSPDNKLYALTHNEVNFKIKEQLEKAQIKSAVRA